MNLRNYSNVILSLLGGMFLFTAWPEKGFAPLLFIAWIPLLIIENYFYENREIKTKKLFGLSYLAFLIWNVFSTWWVWNATDIGSIAAFVCNSLFMTLVFMLFHFTRSKTGNAIGYISLPVYWISFEYIHLQWDLSWPWLTLGNGFASYYKWIQWYEYTGVLGGSLWILVVNILIFKLYKKISAKQFSPDKIGINFQFSIVILIIIIPIVYSLIRYNNYKETPHPINIAIVQPNIDPYNEKFSGLSSHDQLIKLLRLSSSVTGSTTDYLVAPETSLPESIWENNLKIHPDISFLRKYMSAFPKLNVVIGASTAQLYDNGKPHSLTARKFSDSPEFYDAYNTALQLDNFSDSIQVYHKSKLVPGVEKMPYPKIFGFLEKLSINLGGTSGSLGSEKEPLVFISKDSIKIAPIICYESVYGDYVSKYVRKGAQLLFIITNDGWWGNTPGYRQHLVYGRLRAIEMRRNIARSANTGISCFINQRGDISQPTKYWKDDAIKETVNANNEMTFYAKHGDDFFKMFCWAGLFLFVFSLYKKFKSNF